MPSPKVYVDYALLWARVQGRLDAGVTLREVSDATGLDTAILSKFLRGEHRPRALTVEAFAALVLWLGCSADDFIRSPLDFSDCS